MSAPRPRIMRDYLDEMTNSPGTSPREYTPLDQLDREIELTPQLAPARALHALVPRLMAAPRDHELLDPFVAVYELAYCLYDRVYQEISHTPIDREPLRLAMEAQFREIHPSAPPWKPFEPWDLRPEFAHHRWSCHRVSGPAIDRIGLEAKRLAAQAGHATEGQRVVDGVLGHINRLWNWSTSDLTAGRVRHIDAHIELMEFMRTELSPSLELMVLFTDQLPTTLLAKSARGKEKEDKKEEPPADGPEGGRWVRWKGVRHEVPAGNVYNLIALFFSRDSASYDLLDEEVFDDPVTPQTVRSNFSKTNSFLKAIGIPWRLKPDSRSRTACRISAE